MQDFISQSHLATELSLRARTLCARLLYAAHTSPRPQDRHDREGLLYSPGEEAEAQQG